MFRRIAGRKPQLLVVLLSGSLDETDIARDPPRIKRPPSYYYLHHSVAPLIYLLTLSSFYGG